MIAEFIPEDYQIPVTSADQFLRLKAGDNKIRIMSKSVVTGYEIWVDDGGKSKPIRKKKDPFIPEELSGYELKQKGQRHFWAFIVFNYDEQKFQASILTQKSIMGDIQDLTMNVEYGHPSNYDITIKRKGEGMDTEYSVIPSPPKNLPDEILHQWKELKYNLDLVFDGKYPFDIDQVPQRFSDDDLPFE